MKVKWKCDTKEQIIRGIEPCEEKEVEFDLEELTLQQRIELAEGKTGLFVEGTVDELKAALQTFVDKKEEEQKAKEKELADFEENLKTIKIVKANDKRGRWFGGSRLRVEWDRYYVDTSKVGWHNPMSELGKRLSEYIVPFNDEAKRLNSEAEAKALSENAEAIAKAEAELEREKEKIKKRDAEAMAAKLALRKETETVSFDLSRGDGREWGVPWGAVVKLDGRREVYDFNCGTYDLTTEKLAIRCKPGDTIAWGQRNYRKQRRTVHRRAKVNDDWTLTEM